MSTVHVPVVIQIADRPGTVQCPWLRMLPQGLFVLFDMVTCVVLILLLGRKGLDQRRVILYAWCQLPIIECAMQRHVDVIPLTFTILAAAYGFFAAFASEQGQNAGVTQQIVHWLGDRLHVSLTRTITLEHLVDVFVVGIASVIVFALRWRNRISVEAGTLILFGVILSISSHVFPWYTTILLLWVPVLLVPLRSHIRLAGQGLAVVTIWYFTTTVILSYFLNSVQGVPTDWTLYYRLVYWPVMVAICIAVLMSIITFIRFQKRVRYARRSTHYS